MADLIITPTVPVNVTPSAPVVADAAAASWFHAWMIPLVAYGIVLAVSAYLILSAPRGTRLRRALQVGTNAAILLVPVFVFLAWAYRPELTDAATTAWNVVGDVSLWYLGLPWLRMLKYGVIFGVFAAEVVVLDVYLFGYKLMWRSWFPDLVLIRDGRRKPAVVGRIYHTEKTDAGTRVYFAPHYGDPFQIFGRLHVLETNEKLERYNFAQMGYRHTTIVPDATERRRWSLTDATPGTVSIKDGAAGEIVDAILKANRSVAAEAIEGNPSLAAVRISKDTHSRARIPSFRRGANTANTAAPVQRVTVQGGGEPSQNGHVRTSRSLARPPVEDERDGG